MVDRADKVLARKGVVTADFLTEHYRVTGDVTLKGQPTLPLVDMLNEKISGYIRAENAYISPLNDPAVLSSHNSVAQIRKDQIRLIVLIREEDGMTRYSTHQMRPDQPNLYNLYAVLPGLEVRGALRVATPADADNLLMQSAERFITIYRARVKVNAHPDIEFTGGSVLINREAVNLYCVEKAT